jgi:type IV fimbrial biogenesis protein FimT
VTKHNGFTLLELMIVVAIIGIVSSIAAPSFSDMIETNRLKSVTQSLQDDVQFTRTEAIKKSQNIILVITKTSSTAGDWCYGLSTKATCNCTVTNTVAANYCEIKIVTGAGFNTTSVSASTAIAFDFRRGTIPTAVEVSFSTAHYQASNFVSEVGRAVICTPTALTSGLIPLPLRC